MNRSQSAASARRAFDWPQFLAHMLFLLAAWTIFIKYLFPLAFALAEGVAWHTWIFWDLWPAAHVWLGWALLTRPTYTRALAIGMSVVEIAIIATLIALFLSDPEWSIWRTNWFVNKVFVLACFILLLAVSLRHPERFARGKVDTLQAGGPSDRSRTS